MLRRDLEASERCGIIEQGDLLRKDVHPDGDSL